MVVGDLFQLKPVIDSWIFKQSSGSGMEILSANIWKAQFLLFELLDIMRQEHDFQFASLLNRLREGTYSRADIDTLKLRIIRTGSPDYWQ